LENRLTEAKTDIFKLRDLSNTLELAKTRLEDQLRIISTSGKSTEEPTYIKLSEEHHKLQIELELLRLKNEEGQ